MTIEDVFVVKGRGVVATGRVESGTLRVGDDVNVNGGPAVRVGAIEAFRRPVTEAAVGDKVGVVFTDADKAMFHRGDVLSAPTVV
ncbi:MAG: EF-Tu/IF-2/RF-3 family GTPase [Mycobacterium sp.]